MEDFRADDPPPTREAGRSAPSVSSSTHKSQSVVMMYAELGKRKRSWPEMTWDEVEDALEDANSRKVAALR